MNEPTTPLKTPRMKMILGLTVVFSCIYFILFNGVPEFNEQRANYLLKQLAETVTKEALNVGLQASLEHGLVKLEGFGFEKEAVSAPFSLSFVQKLWQGNQTVVMSSDRLVFRPDATDKNATWFYLQSPFQVASGSEMIGSISSKQPIIYKFMNGANGKNAVQPKHSVTLMGEWLLSGISAAPNKTRILFDKPLVISKISHADNDVEVFIKSDAINVNMAEKTYHIGAFDFHFRTVYQAPNLRTTTGAITLDRASFTTGNLNSPATLFTAAFKLTETLSMNGYAESMNLEIERGVIAFDDIKIAVNGILTWDIDDIRPYGNMVFEANNIGKLAQSEWVKKESQTKALAMVDQIFEADAKVRKQAIINLRRKKNDEWTLGISSLQPLIEQGLFNIFITDGIFNE